MNKRFPRRTPLRSSVSPFKPHAEERTRQGRKLTRPCPGGNKFPSRGSRDTYIRPRPEPRTRRKKNRSPTSTHGPLGWPNQSCTPGGFAGGSKPQSDHLSPLFHLQYLDFPRPCVPFRSHFARKRFIYICVRRNNAEAEGSLKSL